jgi:hypothetical protein
LAALGRKPTAIRQIINSEDKIMWLRDEETGEFYEDEIDTSLSEKTIPMIPPEPPMEKPFVPTLMGYGTNIATETSPGKWTDPSGGIAPAKYVQDVRDTINAVDTGKMSENDLSRKIMLQEGVPNRPSNQQLSIFEKLNGFMKHAQPGIEFTASQRADEAKTEYYRQTYPANGMPLLPNQQRERDAKASEIYRTVYTHHYDQLSSRYKDFAEKQIVSEQKQTTTPNEIELTDRALRGDKQAQAILDAIQKRKEDAVRAGKAIQSEGIDIPSMAKSVYDGLDAVIAIKGSMGNPVSSKVRSEIQKINPKFDFAMSDANYKWKQSTTNQRTINFAGGALPRLGALDDQLAKMPNQDINIINRVMREVSTQFGKPEFTNFEANRNAIVQEINTALSGTSQASDLRVKIELDNLQSGRSPAQISGAIANLRMALEARLDVDLSPLYPIEVVRGEKTIEQYKKELFKKYRGNYSVEGRNGGQTNDRIKVKSPNGKVGTIPSSQLQDALNQGYVRAQ